ncbi:Retrovirus-related Pol polyprotein from transposon TNT 1-94 [Anthophora plagiata]
MQAEALLIKNDLWNYVNGKKRRPRVDAADTQTEAAANEWDINDRKAKSDLILSISPSELKQVKACETANEVWEKLRSIYASRGPAKRAALLRKLTSHRMSSGEDVREHINKFIEVVDKLAEMNIDIHKDLQSAMLFNSLPENYENFRCAMESRDDLLDLDILKVKIFEEFETRQQKTSEDHGAMAVKGNYRIDEDSSRKETKPKGQWNNNKEHVARRPKITCYKCGKIGHKASDCYFKKTDYKTYGGKSQELFYVHCEANNETCIAAEDPEKQYWCLDSGCTTHLCRDSSKFIRMKPTDCKKLSLANNASALVKAKGNVCIRTCMNQEMKDIEFEDTLYVPDLRSNLMSVARITDKGNSVIFKKREAAVTGRDGRVKLKAKRVRNLYCILEKQQEKKG